VADGQITYLDTAAPQGEVAFAIATTSGETLSIAMPCDCEALPAGIVEGSTVLAGEPVLTLVEGEQPLRSKLPSLGRISSRSSRLVAPSSAWPTVA
jgi:hypothetical protein